jgi:histidine ammonia-lyase
LCDQTLTSFLRAAILIRMNSLIRGHSGVRSVSRFS